MRDIPLCPTPDRGPRPGPTQTTGPSLRRLAAACALALWGLPVLAQTDPTPTGPDDTSLGEVVVTGGTRAAPRVNAPYALGVVTREALAESGPRINLSEALARVPGLNAANRNNYAQDLQLSSRGFGARAGFGVRGLRIYSDGLPATMPDGQGQVSHLDLAGAQRIEVLRGPFSALYGSSSGGVIATFSAPVTAPRLELSLDRGSNGLSQWQAGVATPLDGGWDLGVSTSEMHFEGFRPQSEARRALTQFNVGWSGEHDRLRLRYGHQEQVADDPLGLSRAQLEANPDQTTPQATQYDTRKTLRQDQVGLSWEHDFTHAGPLAQTRVATYAGTRGVMQTLAIAPATQAAARHGGGVIDFDRRYDGLDARALWQWQDVDVVTGLNVERQHDDRQGYENFVGTGASQVLGVTGALRRDETNDALTREAYGQAEWRFAPQGQLSLGLRHGFTRMTVDDRYLSNGNDSGRLTFRHTTPVLGARWSFSPAWQVYASASRGMETPTLGELAYRADGTGGLNTTLQAQSSRQIEVGTRWRQADVQLEATAFRIRTDDEIGIATNAGGRASYRNVGRTQRDGVELSAQWRLAPRVSTLAALSWLKARYMDDFLACAGIPCSTPTLPVAAGSQIAGTQDRTGYAEVAWAVPWARQAQTALEWRGQSATSVNDANTDHAAGYGLVSWRYRHHFALDAHGGLELLARVDNLADRRVVGSVIVNDANGRYFEPAAGRHTTVSLRYVRRL